MAISPFLTRDPRYGGFRYPGFTSVLGDTGSNVTPPAPSVVQPYVAPPPTNAFETLGFDDDTDGFGGNNGVGPSGAPGVSGVSDFSGVSDVAASEPGSVSSTGPSSGSFSGNTAPSNTQSSTLSSIADLAGLFGNVASIAGQPVAGLAAKGVQAAVNAANRGVNPDLVASLVSPTQPTVERRGFNAPTTSVASTPEISANVGPNVDVSSPEPGVEVGVDVSPPDVEASANVDVSSAETPSVGVDVSPAEAPEAEAGAEAGSDSTGPGGGPSGSSTSGPGAEGGGEDSSSAEGTGPGGGPGGAESSGPGAEGGGEDSSEGGGGGDAGGGGGGGDDSGGDDPGDGPERAGGPVVDTNMDGEVARTAHEGEYVIQTDAATMIGLDALQLINGGDFNPALVRQSLGLPPTANPSFPDGSNRFLNERPGSPYQPGQSALESIGR